MIATSYGGGRHMMYIPPQDIPFALKINFVTQPLYVLAITMTKFSIGMYLLRLTVEKVYRQVIIGTIGTISAAFRHIFALTWRLDQYLCGCIH